MEYTANDKADYAINTQLRFARGRLFSYFSYRRHGKGKERRGGGGAKYPLHVTRTRERYIVDKTYWLVSSFNGNVVPLNGVRTELKKEGKNKGDEV